MSSLSTSFANSSASAANNWVVVGQLFETDGSGGHGMGGLPIVNDEGGNFFCRLRATLACQFVHKYEEEGSGRAWIEAYLPLRRLKMKVKNEVEVS